MHILGTRIEMGGGVEVYATNLAKKQSMNTNLNDKFVKT
jgi:hypothetical protein